jgi:hypothetical protein
VQPSIDGLVIPTLDLVREEQREKGRVVKLLGPG